MGGIASLSRQHYTATLATGLWNKGFYPKKPDGALVGLNDHFIIGCTLNNFGEIKNTIFDLKDLQDPYYWNHPDDEGGETDWTLPQLIFGLDAQSYLTARVEVCVRDLSVGIMAFGEKRIDESEMVKMIEELRGKGVEFYEA